VSENPGLWLEREFTGTGFPNAFYLRYHMYPVYFPILALAAFRNALARDAGTK
jgi:squalene-hopene/tetraprenyl-beta-curcumene cyclase